ncbi:hypothetical protein GCM10010401_10410 [Rarobacter faecitabidus]
MDRSNPLDGPLTAWFGRDEILERGVLVIDVTETAAANGDTDIPAVLDAARRAALVSDRRLVKLLDVSQDSDLAYIVTEEPGGSSIAALLGSLSLTAEQGRALLGELATGLEVAGSRGVHHLDINSDAVFLTPKGPRLLGAGFAAALLGRPVPQEEDAAIFDTDQLRSFVRGLIPEEQLASDPTLSDVLDSSRVFVRPAQLAARLDPWDATTLVTLVDDLLADEDAHEDADKPASAGDAPPLVAPSRTSARARFAPDDQLSPPGTPPPAAPSRYTGLTGATGATPVRVSSGVAVSAGALAGGSASLLGPVLPGAAEPAPPVFAPVGAAGAATGTSAAGGGHSSVSGAVSAAFGAIDGPPVSGPGSHTERVSLSRRLQVSSTFVVLLLIVGLIGVGGVWAALTIGANLEPTHEVRSLRGSAAPVPSTSDGSDGDSQGSSASTAPPVIAEGAALDPDGDGDEHPELVDRAYDGDQQTFWTTRTYKTPNFGGYDRSGIGYGITLENEAQVSAVYLVTESKGGKFELRSTSLDDPSGGELLKSGKFSEDMEIELDKPVTTQSLVLWVTELPKTDDGYAITIGEINLS